MLQGLRTTVKPVVLLSAVRLAYIVSRRLKLPPGNHRLDGQMTCVVRGARNSPRLSSSDDMVKEAYCLPSVGYCMCANLYTTDWCCEVVSQRYRPGDGRLYTAGSPCETGDTWHASNGPCLITTFHIRSHDTTVGCNFIHINLHNISLIAFGQRTNSLKARRTCLCFSALLRYQSVSTNFKLPLADTLIFPRCRHQLLD